MIPRPTSIVLVIMAGRSFTAASSTTTHHPSLGRGAPGAHIDMRSFVTRSFVRSFVRSLLGIMTRARITEIK